MKAKKLKYFFFEQMNELRPKYFEQKIFLAKNILGNDYFQLKRFLGVRREFPEKNCLYF